LNYIFYLMIGLISVVKKPGRFLHGLFFILYRILWLLQKRFSCLEHRRWVIPYMHRLLIAQCGHCSCLLNMGKRLLMLAGLLFRRWFNDYFRWFSFIASCVINYRLLLFIDLKLDLTSKF